MRSDACPRRGLNAPISESFYNLHIPNYRRIYGANAYYFTVVTCNRNPILTGENARAILHEVWRIVQDRHPFTTVAICLLPEHLHAVWTLPEGDDNYSIRWKEIKRQFTMRYLAAGGEEGKRSESRQKRGEAGIWQRRFWEHTITTDDDLSRHVDYIHYNPVRHGLVKMARDWSWSSFRRYVREGYYDEDWGRASEYFGKEKLGE